MMNSNHHHTATAGRTPALPVITSASRWLAARRSRRALQRTLLRAWATFARQHPRWANSLFDPYFLASRAEPLLLAGWTGAGPIDPAAVANAWADQIHWEDARRRQQAVAEAVPVASDFLRLLRPNS